MNFGYSWTKSYSCDWESQGRMESKEMSGVPGAKGKLETVLTLKINEILVGIGSGRIHKQKPPRSLHYIITHLGSISPSIFPLVESSVFKVQLKKVPLVKLYLTAVLFCTHITHIKNIFYIVYQVLNICLFLPLNCNTNKSYLLYSHLYLNFSHLVPSTQQVLHEYL